MDLVIVAFYALCDDLLIQHRYQGEAWRGHIASNRRYFYGLKLHLMVTEDGVPVEFFLTPSSFGDVLGLRCYPFDLPQGAAVYADRAYCNYGIEDALAEAGITLKPLRKKNSKRQYDTCKVYLHHHRRKPVEEQIVSSPNAYPGQFTRSLPLGLR